jgi:hypothetical protein
MAHGRAVGAIASLGSRKRPGAMPTFARAITTASRTISHSANTANIANAVFAFSLFAPTGGSQDGIVRNPRQPDLPKLLANAPAQHRIRFCRLFRHPTGIKLLDGIADAIPRRTTSAASTLCIVSRRSFVLWCAPTLGFAKMLGNVRHGNLNPVDEPITSEVWPSLSPQFLHLLL